MATNGSLSEDEKQMVALIENADRLQGAVSARAAALTRAAASAAARELARRSWKHGGDSPRAREAAAHAARVSILAEQAAARAERDAAPWVPPGIDRAVVHGRVVDARGAGVGELRVVAIGVEGKPLAEEITSDTGYFRLELAAALSTEPPRAARVAVKLSVFAGEKLIFRDKADLTLAAESALYREIAVKR